MIIRRKDTGGLIYVKWGVPVEESQWGIMVGYQTAGVHEVFTKNKYDWTKCDQWILITCQNPRAKMALDFHLERSNCVSAEFYQCNFDFGKKNIIDRILE